MEFIDLFKNILFVLSGILVITLVISYIIAKFRKDDGTEKIPPEQNLIQTPVHIKKRPHPSENKGKQRIHKTNDERNSIYSGDSSNQLTHPHKNGGNGRANSNKRDSSQISHSSRSKDSNQIHHSNEYNHSKKKHSTDNGSTSGKKPRMQILTSLSNPNNHREEKYFPD